MLKEKEKIIFITTFNKLLYKKYAHRLIKSFINTKQDFKLFVFSEDNLHFNNKKIITKNLLSIEPSIIEFIKRNQNKKFLDWRYDAIRFSYKVFSISAGFKFGEKIYFIDADSIFLKKIPITWLKKFLPNSKMVSCYYRKNMHTETGFFAFNTNFKISNDFVSELKSLYTTNKVYNFKENHDGYIFGKLIDKYKKNYNQLIKFNGNQKLKHIIAHDKNINKYIDHTKGELRKYLGYSPETIKLKKRYNIHIIYPEFNKAWKKISSKDKKYKLSPDNIKIRLNWSNFVDKLIKSINFYNKKIKTSKQEYPIWKLNEKFINSFKNKIVLIPHKSKNQFNKLKNPNIFFYMQDLFTNTFTIDKKGWASQNTIYPVNIEKLPFTKLNYFESYSKNYETKYSQNSSLFKYFKYLLTKQKYILIPIQIPNDESMYHSNIGVEEFIKKVTNFCKKKNIHIILKPHPANLEQTRKFKKFCDYNYVKWSEDDLKLLIKNSMGIFTINSAVGLEGILLKKPVVTFGKTLYDCITFKGDINKLYKSINYIKEFDINKNIYNYKKFINWYAGIYSFNLNDENTMLSNALKILNSYKSNK